MADRQQTPFDTFVFEDGDKIWALLGTKEATTTRACRH